jgi:hypothetical protein
MREMRNDGNMNVYTDDAEMNTSKAGCSYIFKLGFECKCGLNEFLLIENKYVCRRCGEHSERNKYEHY